MFFTILNDFCRRCVVITITIYLGVTFTGFTIGPLVAVALPPTLRGTLQTISSWAGEQLLSRRSGSDIKRTMELLHTDLRLSPSSALCRFLLS